MLIALPPKVQKVLKISGMVVAALWLILTAVFYYFIFTLSGAQSALKIAQHLTDGIVGIEGEITGGSIYHGLQLEKLGVMVPGVIYISADKFSLAYDLLPAITRGRFEVSSIASDKLRVHLLSSGAVPEPESEVPEEPEDPNAEPFRLNFPVDIYVHELAVNDFAYLSSLVDVKAGSFKAYLQAVADTTLMQNAVGRDVEVHLKSEGSPQSQSEALSLRLAAILQGREPAPLYDPVKAQHQAEAEAAAKEPVNVYTFDGGNGMIEAMPTVQLPLDITVLNFTVERGRYYQEGFDTGVFRELNLTATWTGTQLSVLRLDAQHPQGEVLLSGLMDFKDHFLLDFNLSGAGALSEENKLFLNGLVYGLQGRAKVYGPLTNLSLNAQFLNPADTTVHARINCLSSLLPVEVDVVSPLLNYPLFDTGERIATVKGLELHALGTVFDGMESTFKGNLTGFGFENYDAAFKGRVSLSDVRIDDLKLQGLYQNAQLNLNAMGQLNYAEEISYAGKLDFLCSDAGVFAPMLKGAASLNGNLSASVVLPKSDDENINVFLDLEKLNASAFLNRVKAELDAAEIHGSLLSGFTIKKFYFTQGVNTVKLQGVASQGENGALTALIDLEDLSLLEPSLKGDFSASLKAMGALESMDLQLTGKSDRFVSGDVVLRRLSLDASGNVADKSFNLTGALNSLRVVKGIKPYRQCVLDLSGDLTRHGVSVYCGGENSLMVSARGSFDEAAKTWQGALDEFFFSSELSGSVQLTQSIDMLLDFANGKGEIAPFTLRTDAGVIAAERTAYGPGMLEAGLSLENVDLKSLNDLMPEGVHLSGPVQMTSSIQVHNNVPDIKLDLQSDNARIFAKGVPLMFEKLSLNAAMVQRRADVTADIALRGNKGTAKVDLAVLDPMGAKRLDGHAALKDLQLDLFMGVGTLFNDLNGAVNLDGDFAGTLSKPLFIGKLNAAGSAEPRYDVGQIDSFDVTLNSLGSHGTLTGYIGLNQGKVNLDGDLDWTDGAYASLAVTAKELPAFLMGFGQAYADVDAKVEFNEYFKVEGTLGVPKALISVSNLSSSGSKPSSDEILVPEGGTSVLMENVSRPVPSIIDLNVSIGDDVKLSAMGLEAGVEGSLKLAKALNDTDIQANGKVELVDGKADLFGHHFIVNYARAGFIGQIANPTLDVEVIADPDEMEDNVEAGVRVTGDTLNPKVTLFSKPSMSQNEVMSYLLYGHGLDKNSSLNEGSNASMLVGLGVSSAGGLVNSVMGAFGVQNLEFNASGSGEETQVEVQGYITRNIRVGYGYGVFNAVGEFKLRYEFMRRLYAEFVSSLDQAVDLIYSFEF